MAPAKATTPSSCSPPDTPPASTPPCFHSALQSAARQKKVKIDGSSVGARISLVRSGEESIDLAVQLEVIIPGLEAEQADELATLAHQMCPYSRAVEGNIEVDVSVGED